MPRPTEGGPSDVPDEELLLTCRDLGAARRRLADLRRRRRGTAVDPDLRWLPVREDADLDGPTGSR